MNTTGQPRSWAGIDLAERQKIRRADLLDAGILLLGAPGGSAVNVRAVCRAAGLTERYFYESFADRDQFVTEVYEQVAALSRKVVLAAVAGVATPHEIPHASVSAYVELISTRPEVGRVLLIAPMTEEGLGGKGLKLAPAFARIVNDHLTRISDTHDRQLVTAEVVGALVGLFIGYLDGSIGATREQLVTHCIEILKRSNRPQAWHVEQK